MSLPRHFASKTKHTTTERNAMTSVYPRILQDRWQQNRSRSSVNLLSSPYQAPASRHRQNKSSAREKVQSSLSYEEEQYERECARIRNFGAHWMRPYGILKTIEQVEDEERELEDTFEEYEDEEGEMNQNLPEVTVTAGQDSLTEIVEPNADTVEVDDLDDEIDDGASFEVDSSFVSTTSIGLHASTNGPRGNNVSSTDHEVVSHPITSHDFDDELHSAQSGSIGDYSDLSE